MEKDLKYTITVIEQGGKYLLNSGGYNTHLDINGVVFAKTSKLQLDSKPRSIKIGKDMRKRTHVVREVDGKEEKMDAESYDQMMNLMREECIDEDENYISLEHEYKYRKAMHGWRDIYNDWVEWEEVPFQIMHLPEVDNECITGYLSSEKIENPLVDYSPIKRVIVVDAFNRLGIDIMKAVVSSWRGVERTLTREESNYRGDPLYQVNYDDTRIVSSGDFDRKTERVSLDKAIKLYEDDVNSVITRYKTAYAKCNAKIAEEDMPKLAEKLERIEQDLVSLSVYVASRGDKATILERVKEAKKLLGVSNEQ